MVHRDVLRTEAQNKYHHGARWLLVLALFLITVWQPASAQTINSYPYVQGFETYLYGWETIDGDGDGYGWQVLDMSQYEALIAFGIDVRAYEGRHVISSSSSTTSSDGMSIVPLYPSNWLISPQFELTAEDTLSLSWYCRIFSAAYAGDRYEVLLSYSSDDTLDFTVQLYTETVDFDTYARRTVSLADYIGETIRIAFHHYNCSNNSSIMLDRVSIANHNQPEVALQGPTRAQLGDTVTFTAVQTFGLQTNATFQWSADGASYLSTSPDGTTASVVWENTGYQPISVTVDNGYGTDSATANVFVFDCNVVTSYPFYENFQAELPCWHAYDADEDGEAWLLNNGYVSSSSQTYFWADEQDNWLFTQPMLFGSDDYVVSWKVAPGDDRQYAEHYSVMISTDTDWTNLSHYTEVYSETLNHFSGFEQRYVTLNQYAGQQVIIAFRHHATHDGNELRLTDFEVGLVGAPLVHIVAPTRAIAGDSVCLSLDTLSFSPITDITWTLAADAYGNTYQESSMDPFCYRWESDADEGYYWAKVAVTNSLGTAYDSVRIYLYRCDPVEGLPYAHTFGLDEQCWRNTGWQTSSYTVDYDRVNVPAAVSFSFDYRGNALPAGNSLASPYIRINDEDIYELKYLVAEGGALGDRYSVVVHYDGNADTLLTETLGSNSVMLRKLSLENYTGVDIQIEFLHQPSATGYALMIAGVEVRPITAPTVRIVAPSTARSNSTVRLKAEVSSAVDVSYNWSIAGANPSSATDSIVDVVWDNGGEYSISLTVNNAYGDAIILTTIAITDCPIEQNAPYSDHFEQGIGCWSDIDFDGDGFGWENITASAANDRSINISPLVRGTDAMISWSAYPMYDMASFLQYHLGSPLSTENYLCSPGIHLAEGSSWWLTFFVASLGEMNADLDYYEVRLATEEPQSAADYTTIIAPLAAAPGDNYRQMAIDLSAYAGQTVWLAFVHRTSGRYALLLDDVAITQEYVGINPIDSPNISLYPNPTSGLLNVSADGLISIELLDQTGRTLNLVTEQSTINLEAYPAGTYFARIVTASGTTVKRVVKR